MFDTLTNKLSDTLRNLAGKGRLTEDNIKETLRTVRRALLEADVALSVLEQLIETIKVKALGQTVIKNIDPGQAFVKIVQDELTHLMGDTCESLDLKASPPAVVLLAGLQGAGKTTTAAKLAHHLKREHKKSVLLVSTDVYRPAAIDQLKTLAKQIDTEFFPSDPSQKPVDIARAALEQARKTMADVVIVDTAGRLHIDDAMMQEVQTLHQTTSPVETLFVVDSMTGQDAAKTAKVFGDALPLTGVILTKTDGDARGGAALSVRQVTGKPIKFLGTGETIAGLSPFHPDRVASRILGMGDVLSLVEEAERKLDKKKAEKMAKKLKKGKGFDLEDFLQQIEQMNNMGGVAGLMDKLPGMPGISKEKLANSGALSQFGKFKAIIESMTPKERRFPALLKGSRKRRVAQGSGTQVQEVNQLLKQFTQMQKMMKKLAKGGMKKMMRNMQGMMPPGMGDLPDGFPK